MITSSFFTYLFLLGLTMCYPYALFEFLIVNLFFQDLTESAIEDCSKAIELDPTYVRALLRRAQLYEKKEKLDEALEDYSKVLELDPGNTESFHAVKVSQEYVKLK